MTVDLALQLMGDTLLTALLVSAPILGLSMVVGLAISVLQVITQVQEVSLTFVPKIVTVVVTMVVFGPWMLRKLLAFSSALIGQAGAY